METLIAMDRLPLQSVSGYPEPFLSNCSLEQGPSARSGTLKVFCLSFFRPFPSPFYRNTNLLLFIHFSGFGW